MLELYTFQRNNIEAVMLLSLLVFFLPFCLIIFEKWSGQNSETREKFVTRAEVEIFFVMDG